MFSITGKLKVKNNTQQVTEKFKKREFVITDESSQYPQDIMFQLAQDKCDLLDPFNEGQEIKVNFNLRGREWTSPQGEVKYFNTLDAWRLENAAQQGSELPPMPEDEPMHVQNDESDDLPF